MRLPGRHDTFDRTQQVGTIHDLVFSSRHHDPLDSGSSRPVLQWFWAYMAGGPPAVQLIGCSHTN